MLEMLGMTGRRWRDQDEASGESSARGDGAAPELGRRKRAIPAPPSISASLGEGWSENSCSIG
jgi:hypothetical protein